MHVQVFMVVDGEAIMNDMINTGCGDDEGDYTQAEPDTQPGQHDYDIGAEPLFPTNSHAHGGRDDGRSIGRDTC
jgi:hypothetical protein